MRRSRRINRRSNRMDDESENEEDNSTPGPSRTSSSQPVMRNRESVDSDFLSQQTGEISEHDLQILEDKCIQRILMNINTMKPFKSLDLFSGLNLKPRRQAIMIERIKQTLLIKFGVELAQLEGKSFIVVSPHNSEVHKAPTEPTDYDVFLNTILALIYFCRGKIQEDFLIQTVLPKLFPHLSRIGCKDNVPKMLQEMESHLYIRKEHDKLSESAIIFWGLRAIKEVDKKRMLPILCQLGNVEENRLPEYLLQAIENDVDFA